MRQPPELAENLGFHLAEFNWGVLKYDWDDPRVADFVNALERVDALAQRRTGYVWQMSEEDMSFHQNDPDGVLGANPRLASKLSVWETPQSLWHFAYHTVHNRFVTRGPEWYDMNHGIRMVLWWVPIGHRPTIQEAVEKRDLLLSFGSSHSAFGWDWLKTAPVT